MGIFDKIGGFFEDIFGAIGDALSWLLGVPDADDYAGQLINKNSNVANLPVVYGRRLVGGTRVFVSTGGNNKNEYMYIVLALSEGEIQAINSVYVNDKLMVGTPVSGKPYRKVTGGDYKDIIWYQTFTGTDDQTACTTLFNDIGSGPDDFWGANHRLRGVAYIAMVVKYHQDKGMTSIPEIRCEIQGRKVYDPRTETTVWTSNPALCLRDYLTNERFGKGLPDSAIDDEAFGAAATFCDSTVSSYTGGPSINTFSLNMILDTGNTLFDNTKRFLLAMRGIMPYSEGKYSLIIDKDDASVGTIDESICTRDITIKSVNKNTKLNQVKAVFVNPYKRYEQDSVIWPPAGSLDETTFLSEDNNQVLSKDLTLDTVTNFYQARELARVAVLASRSSSIICELVCTSEALKYAVGDIITLEQPSMGWVGPAAKEFRILSIQLAVSGEVGLTLQEYDSSIYPWVTGSEQDDQPETTLPNPNSVDAITTASVTTGSQVLNDGTIQYFADLTWTPPSDELIQDYVVKINKKVGSVTTENVETITTINNKARYILTDTNAQYGYTIQARNGAQVTSEPLTVAPVAVVTDTTAPADITSLNATGKLQQIELKWVNPTDPDFDVVYIKQSDTDTEPTEVFAQVKTNTFTHEVGAYSTTKYYWVAPVDTSGNIGNYTGPESATTGSIGIGDIPHVAGTFYLTLGDNDAPTNAEFAGAVGRNPIEGDVAVVNKAYFFTRGASAWTAVTEFIDGSLLVSDSITTTQINTDSVLAESILANTADITGDLTVTSGKITVQDTDTVINLDPDAQYPFRISQGTEDVVRLGSSTLDPFIKGAFIRGMPVQSINEADLTTFVRNVVGVTSEEKTETETLTHLPTGGNLVYLEADNITTGLTTVLTLESVAGTQSWVYEYADESDWDSGDSAFFNYTLQGYNGSTWEDIPLWVNRPVFASGYRISGALIGWSISETYSVTIEDNTYTQFRMVVGNMPSEFGGGVSTTSTGINCDFKLTAVTGSQVNSDNYADSFSINNTTGVMTIGRTGSLGDLTADISTYVGNQVSALVDSAPTTLDTLNELASALGDDPNFATTVTNSIGTKWTQDNTKISNWDTAYGWGDHSTAGYLTSHQDISGKADLSGDTFTGNVTISKESPTLILSDNNGATGSYPAIEFKTTNSQDVKIYHTEFDSELPFTGYGLVVDASSTNTQFPTTGEMGLVVIGQIYTGDNSIGSTHRVWHSGDFTSTNTSNWDAAYGWGNHATQNYAVTTGDTFTGNITINAQIRGVDNKPLVQVFNTDEGYFGSNGRNNLTLASINNPRYRNGSGNYSTIFHDGYHPNADKWTNSRTITLGGDLTGSVSLDGSSNVTLSAQVANDSHTHDGRYYTIGQSDNRFMQSKELHNRFYVNLGNVGTRWYKLGRHANTNGFVQMQGTIGSHVESFGTSKFDLTLFVREGNSGAEVSVDGTFTVAHQGTGVKVIRVDDDGGYEGYEIWLKTPNYAQCCVDVNSVGLTYDGESYVTTEPTGFETEIDMSSYGQGTYTVNASQVTYEATRGLTVNTDNGFISIGQAGKGQSVGGRSISIEGNTGTDGEGSGRIFFAEHNSTTASMDKYGMSLGYRGGSTSVVGASGNTWTGLSAIGNGQWGMWGHDNNETGNLIMFGDRQATYVNFSGNYLTGVGYYQIGGTTVIDSSRNLTNIGTISASGSISVTGYNSVSAFSGSFSYITGALTGNVTGNLTGNADTATKWQDARTITLGGDLTGSVSLDGSSNVTLSAQVVNDSHTHDGRYYTESESNTRYLNRVSSLESNLDTKYDADLFGFSPSTTGRPENYGQGISIVSSGNTHNNSNNWITQLAFGTSNNSMYFRGKVNAGGWSSWKTVFHDGYHPNADKWTTARTLSLTGDVTGSVSWDGSANASITTTVANDSHNHDHSDGSFTVNGNLSVNSSGSITLNQNGAFDHANTYESWRYDYTVGAGVYQRLRMNDGSYLTNGGVYVVKAHISGTGTDQGSSAVFWNQNGSWKVNVTSMQSTSSNYPQFLVHSGTPHVYIAHSSGYTVTVYAERYELGEGTGTDNYGGLAGADSFLSNYAGNLRFNPWGGSDYTAGHLFLDSNNYLKGARVYPCTANDTGIYIGYPTATYGSIKVEGSKGGWAGYAIKDDWVFMANGSATCGIYNDTRNEWAIVCNDNAEVRLYHNGAIKLETASYGIDVHGGNLWSETGTQGTGKGGIHLDPASSTDHYGSAITFGASDSGDGATAQAGIYTRTDGSYGTKMMFSTTDSYSSGSKTAMLIDHQGHVDLRRGALKISGTTVIDSSRNLTNIGSITASGTYTNDTASTIIDVGNSGEVILADHTGNTTPVPFSIRKSGTALSDNSSYGVLHLDRLNHNTSNVGAGSNLYFRLKNNSGSLSEYAGIGGEKVGNTTGRLSFYTYGRDRAMVLEEDGYLNLCNPSGAYRFYGDNNTGFVGGFGSGTWGGDSAGDLKAYVQGDNSFTVRTNGGVLRTVTNSSGFDLKTGSYKVNGTTVIDSSRNLVNIGTISKTLITASEGREIESYMPSSYGINSIVSGHRYGWYNDNWYIGMCRSGNAAGEDFGFDYNGSRKFGITNTGQVEVNGVAVIDSSRNLTNIGSIDSTGRLTITNTGAGDATWTGGILIKNTNPTAGEPAIAFQNTAMGSNYWIVGSNQDNEMHFSYGTAFQDGNTKVVIKSDGKMGIGVGAGTLTNQLTVGGNTQINGTLTATGNITAYSDVTLKDNITEIDNALEKVNSIRGVTYDRIDQDNARHAGVIAQEVEEVLPEVVHTDDNGIKSVAYGNMVGLLIEAIKEQQAQINELKEELKNVNSN